MSGIPNPPAYMCGPNTTNSLSVYKGRPRQKVSDETRHESIENADIWISVYVNSRGLVETRSSVNLKDIKEELTGGLQVRMAHVYEHMRVAGILPEPQQECFDEAQGRSSQKPAREFADSACSSNSDRALTNPKRRRVDSRLFDPQVDQKPVQLTEQASTRKGSTIDDGGPSNSTISAGSLRFPRDIALRVDDTQALEDWLGLAFAAVQQQSCRCIAKEWIKLIQPKKQSTHPYNGNFPKMNGVEKGDPEKTKPPYWPPGVKHKEPDHIDKPSRIELLVGLIIQTPIQQILHPPVDPSQKLISKRTEPAPREIYAEDLLKVLEKKKDELQDKWEIIVNIIETRKRMEEFREGGIDGDARVSIPDYSEEERPRGKGKSVSRKSKDQGIDAAQEAPLDDDEDDDDGSNPSTQTSILSPLGSKATPADSENDNSGCALNQSFSSTLTQDSALSSTTQSWKPEPTLGSHLRGQPDISFLNSRMSQMPHNELSYSHQGDAVSRRAAMPPIWPSTVDLGVPPDGMYNHGMGLSHHPGSMAETAHFVSAMDPNHFNEANMINPIMVPENFYTLNNPHMVYGDYHPLYNNPHRVMPNMGDEFSHEHNFMLPNGQPAYRRGQ